MKFIKNRKGLSLMQVVGVLVVLAIILAIAVVNINSSVNNADLTAKQSTAGILEEYVSKYIIENGQPPIVDLNVNYYVEPALIDISLIAPHEEEKFAGNYFLYGKKHQVFYDYPPNYILKIYNEYSGEKPLVSGTSEINVQKLFNEGLLRYLPQTKYILIDEYKVEQSAN